MAADATGIPTSPDNIPTFNTAVDAPSGDGSNAQMAAIQTGLTARILKSLMTAAGDLLYASGVSTPARLAVGTSGQVLTVSGGLPAWATPASTTPTTNAQTGTTYTLVLGDANNIVELSNAAAITCTIPLNSSVAYPVGTVITLIQTGAGQVTVAAGGTTLVSNPGLKLAGQYAVAALLKRGTDSWILYGNISA